MESLRAAIIGTGRPSGTPGATGCGMAHSHVKGYKQATDVKLVAVADIKRENGEKFVTEHELPAKVYTDYHQMLAKEKPDVVSICTWPHLHAEMTIAAAEAGARAIHCEKPMAITFGDAKKIHQTCVDRGVQLTFNHQRRFNTPFRKARELLKDGAIGKLLRIETQCGNLYDWGTHWFDMMFFFNDQTPAEWVMGQIETRGDHQVFDAHIEGQGLSQIKFQNDVRGLMTTGHHADWGAQIRLVGSTGMIELQPNQPKDGPPLRMWAWGQTDWKTIQTTEGIHGQDGFTLAVLDVIDALRNGREPELSSRRALQATELIFATYESSRKRGRVDLPLQIEDSPYLAMLNAT
jgi:predicted dehydrogenase